MNLYWRVWFKTFLSHKVEKKLLHGPPKISLYAYYKKMALLSQKVDGLQKVIL